jgi:dCTP deaminase
MILCDREIEALMRQGLIRISPEPPKDLWTSTAIDLTLHRMLLRWEPKVLPDGSKDREIRPFAENFNVQGMMEDPHIAVKVPIPRDGYPLDSKEFILGFTREKVYLPHHSRIAARVEGKSSLARLGLGVHVTAPTIHSGFGAKEGQSGIPIQLEIFNLGPWKVTLGTGMPICQIIFEEVRETPSAGYGGQFASQSFFSVPPQPEGGKPRRRRG